MSTFRGFVICSTRDEGVVSAQTGMTHSLERIDQAGNDVAFLAQGRGVPHQNGVASTIAGVDAGAQQFVVVGREPDDFKLIVGVTVGLCLPAAKADPCQWSPALRRLWSAVDSRSESGIESGFAYHRWDIECSCFDRRVIDAMCTRLRAMSEAMEQEGISHRICLFENGWGTELGELECDADDLFSIGPDSYVGLRWTSAAGEHCGIIANSGGDVEFEG